MTPKIALVHDEHGDWVGLYVNGELTYEGHSINDTMLLEFIGIEFTHFDVDGHWLGWEVGGLPEKFEDIPDDKKVTYG